MTEMLLVAVTAFWLGLLTSISPCPLATNIAAISYIGREASAPRRLLLSGVLYTVGRMTSYIVIGAVLVAGLLSIPMVANALQLHMNKLLGPLLIVIGMFLLGLLEFNFSSTCGPDAWQRRLGSWGMWGAAPLGMLLALAFCPVSAALFFGALVPLSVKHGSSFFLPALFGVGTGLPVLVFAVLIGYGVRSVGKMFNQLTKAEVWLRYATGAVFVLIGLYYSLRFIFGVLA
jgi:cytochrome c biogenesis protein CcdA